MSENIGNKTHAAGTVGAKPLKTRIQVLEARRLATAKSIAELKRATRDRTKKSDAVINKNKRKALQTVYYVLGQYMHEHETQESLLPIYKSMQEWLAKHHGNDTKIKLLKSVPVFEPPQEKKKKKKKLASDKLSQDNSSTANDKQRADRDAPASNEQLMLTPASAVGDNSCADNADEKETGTPADGDNSSHANSGAPNEQRTTSDVAAAAPDAAEE